MDTNETVHITSQVITVDGRFMKQRCVWCGELITDYDLSMCASSDGSAPSGFEGGILVAVDGENPRHTYKIENQDRLPDTFCGFKYNLNDLKI